MDERPWTVTAVLAVVMALALAVAMFIWLARALNEQPSCAERGGIPTTYRGEPGCLVPGGIIQPE